MSGSSSKSAIFEVCPISKDGHQWVSVQYPTGSERPNYKYMLQWGDPLPPKCDLANIDEVYRRHEEEFKNTPYFQAFKKALKSVKNLRLVLEGIICCCIGSFSWSEDLDVRNCFFQLAAVEYMRETLNIDKKKTLFQDPAFNTLDKQWLEKKGYKWVKDPGAYIAMTPETVFYNAGGDFFVTVHALEVAAPKVYIGTALEKYRIKEDYIDAKPDNRNIHDFTLIPDYQKHLKGAPPLPYQEWVDKTGRWVADVVCWVAVSENSDLPKNLEVSK